MVNWESIATSIVLAIVMWMAGTFKALIAEQKKRYEGTEAKLNLLMEAQQATMRTTLIHNIEKYFERGWVTPEERASWCDMHERYRKLGANGLIDTYRAKLDRLHDKDIDIKED